MSREYQLFLDDMRAACEKTIRFSQGLTLAEFLADAKTHDAVMRNLEIIGEAAKHIPEEVRKRINMVSGGEHSGYGILNVRENLWMFSQLYGVPTNIALKRIDFMLKKWCQHGV